MATRRPKPRTKKSHAQTMLNEHARLMNGRVASFVRTGNRKTASEITEIIESAKKWLKKVNAERAKRAQKPLTMQQALIGLKSKKKR